MPSKKSHRTVIKNTEYNRPISSKAKTLLKNAIELKKRIENETSLQNINIISINDTKHRVLLGPYSNINALQSAYNGINKLNFENIELIRND